MVNRDLVHVFKKHNRVGTSRAARLAMSAKAVTSEQSPDTIIKRYRHEYNKRTKKDNYALIGDDILDEIQACEKLKAHYALVFAMATLSIDRLNEIIGPMSVDELELIKEQFFEPGFLMSLQLH